MPNLNFLNLRNLDMRIIGSHPPPRFHHVLPRGRLLGLCGLRARDAAAHSPRTRDRPRIRGP